MSQIMIRIISGSTTPSAEEEDSAVDEIGIDATGLREESFGRIGTLGVRARRSSFILLFATLEIRFRVSF